MVPAFIGLDLPVYERGLCLPASGGLPPPPMGLMDRVGLKDLILDLGVV